MKLNVVYYPELSEDERTVKNKKSGLLGKQFSTPFTVSPVYYNNRELRDYLANERTSEEIHINNFITSWGVSDW